MSSVLDEVKKQQKEVLNCFKNKGKKNKVVGLLHGKGEETLMGDREKSKFAPVFSQKKSSLAQVERRKGEGCCLG